MFPVFGLDNRIWHAIFIFSMVLNMILLIAALGTNEWLKQNYNDDRYHFEMKGGLIGPTGTTRDWNTIYNDCGNSDFCKQYQNFYTGGIFFIALSIPELLMMTVVILINIIYMNEKSNLRQRVSFKISNLCIFVATFIHVLSFAIWAGFVKLSTSCDNSWQSSSPQPVCPLDGANLAIAGIVFITISAIVHIVVAKHIITGFANQESNNGVPLTN